MSCTNCGSNDPRPHHPSFSHRIGQRRGAGGGQACRGAPTPIAPQNPAIPAARASVEWRVQQVIEAIDGNPAGLALCLRHYSCRRSCKSEKVTGAQKLFVGPGEKLVHLTECGRAVVAWRKAKYRMDGQQGAECALYRNESGLPGVPILRESVCAARQKWPGERLFTLIDPSKISSQNPGFVFKQCGFFRCGMSGKGHLIFERF